MPVKLSFGARKDPEKKIAQHIDEAPVSNESVTEEKNAVSPSFMTAFLDGLIFNNLSLVDFVGLTPIIAGGSTVKSGGVLSVATLIVLVAVTLFAAKFGKFIPEKFAPAAYTVISAAIVMALAIVGYTIVPETMMAIGIIFPLVAVNGITLNRVKNFSGRSLIATLGDALGKGLGFTFVMFVVSAFREILGYGTFFNIAVPFFETHCIPILAGVPGGLLIMAVLAWLIRVIGFKTGSIKDEEGEVAK